MCRPVLMPCLYVITNLRLYSRLIRYSKLTYSFIHIVIIQMPRLPLHTAPKTFLSLSIIFLSFCILYVNLPLASFPVSFCN